MNILIPEQNDFGDYIHIDHNNILRNKLKFTSNILNLIKTSYFKSFKLLIKN